MTTGTIKELVRLKLSKNGNPKFQILVLTEEGNVVSIETKTDSAIAYGIENYRGKKVSLKTEYYRNKLVLTSVELA